MKVTRQFKETVLVLGFFVLSVLVLLALVLGILLR